MESRNKAINMAPKVVSKVSSGISQVGVEARKTHSGLSFSAFYYKAGAETPSLDLPVDREWIKWWLKGGHGGIQLDCTPRLTSDQLCVIFGVRT
jgi:hypothetical protein